MAFTADAIISNIESRLGQNGRHVWDFYKLATGTYWCVGEVCYTFNKTGNKARIFDGKAVFYVPYAQEWMAKHYKTIYDYRKGGRLSDVRKGDVIIFMWTIGSRDHIGFARSNGKDTELDTIEGNTSGGIVAKRTRAKKYIYGVYRPPYQTSTAPKKTQESQKWGSQNVAKSPNFAKGKTYKTVVDCLNVRTGPGTNYAVKKKNDLTADGKKNSNSKGQLNKGTKVTVQEVKKVGSNIWLRIPSGWICGFYNGKQYVK